MNNAMQQHRTKQAFNLETQEWEEHPEEDTNALGFLQGVYRDVNQPLSVRMRAATVAIQFESPKLAAVSYLTNADDFAARLDSAIKYMENRMKLIIDARPVPDNDR